MKSRILSLAEDPVKSFTATSSQADSSGNAFAAGRTSFTDRVGFTNIDFQR